MAGPQIRRHCPKCRTPHLIEKKINDDRTRIDVCPSCRGGWFDSKELAEVLSVAMEDFSPPTDAQKTTRICPNCGILLAQIHYPETQVAVDVCEECMGVWLDKGEFRAINIERARYQNPSKFADPTKKPETLKQAVVMFVDRMLTRVLDRR